MKNVHVIPTDKPSRLHLGNSGLVLCDLNYSSNTINSQNIYITSNEEIKDCCVLSTHTNEVYFLKGYYGIQPINKKIILTTDQDLIKIGVQAIDDEFLEWFVKNPSCEFVEVGLQQESLGEVFNGKNTNTMWTDPKYKIIIPQEELKQEYVKCTCANSLEYSNCGKKCERILDEQEPKQETIEETYLNQLIDEANKEFTLDRKLAKDVAVKYANWQSKRMYSEEECYKYLHSLMTDIELKGLKINDDTDLKQWFVQFKKK
jgi:hypothetical protein